MKFYWNTDSLTQYPQHGFMLQWQSLLLGAVDGLVISVVLFTY